MKGIESVGKYNLPPFTGLAGVHDLDCMYVTFPNVLANLVSHLLGDQN